jgi:hypothetical protein
LNATPSSGAGSCPGSQSARTRSGDGAAPVVCPLAPFTTIVALRTIDGVPGRRSTARIQRASAVPVGSVNSCVSSILSAASVNSAGIGSARSGLPIRHSFFSVTAGNCWSSAPRGLPPVAQVRMTSSSFGDSVCARLLSP